MTSSQAIRRGLAIVSLPILPIIFLSAFAIFAGLQYFNFAALLSFIVAVFIGASLGCLWGAWQAPRWRLWALQNVEDTQDLLPKAIAAGIINKPGHWLERFEIKSEAHREQEKVLIAKIKKGERDAYIRSRPYEYTHIEDSYVFWARPWDTSSNPLMAFRVKYMLCQVTDTTIELDCEGDKLSIQLADIVSCKESIYWGRHGGGAYYVELNFPKTITFRKGAVDVNRVYIPSINPLNASSSRPERDALLKVINDLRTDIKPTVERNPYRRQLIREDREDEFFDHIWDPSEPPPAYVYIANSMDALQLLFVIIGSIGLPFGLIYLIMSRLESMGILE